MTRSRRASNIPVCEAAVMREQMSLSFAGGILAEAITGNSVLFRADELPKPRPCKLCDSVVYPDQMGQIEASNCLTSGSCEKSWTDMYPSRYFDEDGKAIAKRLPCGGFACAAVITLGDNRDQVGTLEGTCAVELANAKFQKDGHELLRNMPLDGPEDFEVFDGQV